MAMGIGMRPLRAARSDLHWLTDFETQRLAGHPLERRRLTCGGPHFELRIPRRAKLQEIVVAAIVQGGTGDRLLVAPVEALGEAQDRRQRPDRPAPAPAHRAELLVAAFRRAASMVFGDERDRLDVVGLEAPQIAVLDQVVRMPVML